LRRKNHVPDSLTVDFYTFFDKWCRQMTERVVYYYSFLLIV